MPVIGIHGSELIDGIVWELRTQEEITHNQKEILLYFCITIYRCHERSFFVKLSFFGEFFDGISDIRSFYFSFSRDIARMRNTENFNPLVRELF